ncbi:MAG: zinc-binding dehydrogenase [bacterium]|nr:zinc-binding dehydrogenase [bacterium]
MLASLLLEPGRLELRDIEIPKAGPGEVIVRIRAALTCGTDLKTFRRGHPKIPTPTPLGHEFSGDIFEIGDGVTDFKVGDQIMTAPTAPCGECVYCKKDLENLCNWAIENMVHGAYAEYVRVPAHIVQHNMFKKPEHLTYGEAAMLEPLSCVVYGMDQVNVQATDTVLVIGAGAIGLLHIMVARVLGAGRIVVAGHRENRLKLARALGADVAIDANIENTYEKIMDLTEGLGADVVIECTGQLAVWEAAPSLARRGGTVILFGGLPSGTQASFDTYRLHYDQITLKGVFHYTRAAVKKAYQLLVDKKIRVNGLISGTYSLSDLKQVFDTLIQKGSGIKFNVVPPDTEPETGKAG